MRLSDSSEFFTIIIAAILKITECDRVLCQHFELPIETQQQKVCFIGSHASFGFQFQLDHDEQNMKLTIVLLFGDYFVSRKTV